MLFRSSVCLSVCESVRMCVFCSLHVCVCGSFCVCVCVCEVDRSAVSGRSSGVHPGNSNCCIKWQTDRYVGWFHVGRFTVLHKQKKTNYRIDKAYSSVVQQCVCKSLLG